MWINSYGLKFCDNYFVPFALYFRKIIKKSKEYQSFWDHGSVFSGHVETLILKFSPESATKVRLPGRGGRNGRGEEGRRRGRKRRRDGMFQFPPPHTLKCVATAPWNVPDVIQNWRIIITYFITRLMKHHVFCGITQCYLMLVNLK